MCTAVGLFAGSPPLFYRDSLHGACCWGELNMPTGVAGQEVCRVLAGLVSELSAGEQSANYNILVPLSSPVALKLQQNPSRVMGELPACPPVLSLIDPVGGGQVTHLGGQNFTCFLLLNNPCFM